MKLVYLGIDLLDGALKALLKRKCEIAEIFTCPTDNRTEFNTSVIATAKKLGIPYSLSPITAEDLDRLAANGCTHLLSAGYYYKIPVEKGWEMANIHPAPLPDYRGGWPMPLVLLHREKEGGLAVHCISAGFDEGDILFQQRFPAGAGLTLAGYMRKAVALLPEAVDALLSYWENKNITPEKQGTGHYYFTPKEEVYTVTPAMTVREADLILRAFYGYECYYRTGTAIYELIGARARRGKGNADVFPLRDGHIICTRIRDCTEEKQKK